jgi:hypothetical protein
MVPSGTVKLRLSTANTLPYRFDRLTVVTAGQFPPVAGEMGWAHF